MGWRTEWKAISDRIEGLLEAGQFFLKSYSVRASDDYGTMRHELLPHARSIYQEIIKFQSAYSSNLPFAAANSINRFIELYRQYFNDENIPPLGGLKLYLPCLASFRSEFTFHLSDIQAVAKRITESAFIHLQRLIIADQIIKERWLAAFNIGENACEKLGASHLLWNGIWAFKASAQGERTDLILGEPLTDLSNIESTAEALVLTEWKVVRSIEELYDQATQAFRQASIYSSSSWLVLSYQGIAIWY